MLLSSTHRSNVRTRMMHGTGFIHFTDANQLPLSFISYQRLSDLNSQKIPIRIPRCLLQTFSQRRMNSMEQWSTGS